MKLFRKPCVSDAQVLDAMKKDPKFRLANERELLAQQVENEYEYVRREHGYDFMPPSQYVPSQSLSEDTGESEVPRTRIEIPMSDISDSVYEDMGVYGNNHTERKNIPNTGKHNVSTARMSNQKVHRRQHHERLDQLQPQQHRPSQPRPRSPRQPPYPNDAYKEELRQLPYRTERQPKSPHRRRSGEAQRPRSPFHENRYHHHEPSRRYDDFLEHSSDIYNDRRVDRRRQKDYMDDGYGRARVALTPTSRPLQTAYSYASEESDEEETFDSRYEVGQTRQHNKQRSRQQSGWGESEKSFNAYWRHKRESSSDLEEFTTPVYARKGDSTHDHAPPKVISESRYPPQEKVQRHRGRDIRDPIFEERADRAGIRQRTSSREFGVQRKERSPSTEHYWDENLQYDRQMGYRKMSNKELNVLKKQEVKAAKEKRKSKGILGRIRDSVRGGTNRAPTKKGNQPSVQNIQNDDQTSNKNLRHKGSLFETTSPLSDQSDDNPHYQFEAPSARVPYPYDDASPYHQSRRGRKGDPPPDFEPPLPQIRQTSKHNQSLSAEEQWYDSYNEGVEMRRTRSSVVPFESARPPPPLRRNPEPPHRQIPLAASMSKHYRNTTVQKQQQLQVGQPPVNGIPHRISQSPDLNFDARQVKAVTKPTGFIGCY